MFAELLNNMNINMKKIILSVFVLSILLPTLAFASFDVSLKYGSRGEAVIELQDFLQDQGFLKGNTDGRFGLGTRKAVISFQKANGLKGDGYFGLGSRAKANFILATELKPSEDAEQAETATITPATISAPTNTTTTSTVDGCTSSVGFSPTTGASCATSVMTATTYPAGCSSTLGFSSTTGQACNGIISPESKSVISVAELKKQDPQQYKELVTENKTQLLEASKSLQNRKILARVKPSVVYIETTTGSGSGIIISSDGYVLTNAHVVTGKNSAIIKLTDGQSLSGIVIGRDENIDLALLKVGATNLSPAFLGDSDSVEQGDEVFTLGYPLGLEGEVSFKNGTLSRRLTINGISYMEISAQILQEVVEDH